MDLKSDKNIDLFIRKVTDNSTYVIISSILGCDLGNSITYMRNKDANYYQFRDYGENKVPETGEGTHKRAIFYKNKITYDKEIPHVKWNKDDSISMMNNFKVSQNIVNDEYMYYCEPDLTGLDADEANMKSEYQAAKNKVRLHTFLFPLYVDVANNSNVFDYKFLKDLDIEINFGRRKIQTLNDFKAGFSFEWQSFRIADNPSMYSGPRRVFDLFERDKLKDIRNENSNTPRVIGNKYTKWSRCRTSRGNRSYKYKVAACRTQDLEGASDYNTSNTGYFTNLRNHKMHTDMIYGHGSEVIHPVYQPDDFVDKPFIKDNVNLYPNYKSHSMLPNYPTVCVDFVRYDLKDEEKYTSEIQDNLKLIGFIRLRMFSYLNLELNADILSYYGYNKKNINNANNGSKEYDRKYACVAEMTNSESFTVKFSFPKRKPTLMNPRNTITGASVYMLPPSLFASKITPKNNLDMIINKQSNPSNLYEYTDFNAYTYRNMEGNPTLARYIETESGVVNLMSMLGGWLFPPVRMSSLQPCLYFGYDNLFDNVHINLSNNLHLNSIGSTIGTTQMGNEISNDSMGYVLRNWTTR